MLAKSNLLFTVIIVNHNGGNYPAGAIQSLAAQTCRDFEVIFVDNASRDGSALHLETDGMPSFTLLLEDENHGFARGNNLAARQAKGDWLVLLNPDAAAHPDWLEKIAEAIERFPSTRMFASTQYAMESPGLLDGAGDAYLIFGIPWRGGVCRPRSELPGIGECFSPCGAGAVYHRDTFLSHNGFDERFFCFCEDVDLGFRMRLAGENCIFLPDAIIEHAGGALSGRQSDFSHYHGARNRLWTYFKNMPWPIMLVTLPGHVAISIYLLIRHKMTRQGDATWRGMRDGLTGIGAIRRDKSYGPPKRKVSLWKIARAMAWNPFAMSKHEVHVTPLRDQAER